MKKLILFFVLLAYGLSSFGMTLHVHFCCGKLDAVRMAPIIDNACPMEADDQAEECCNDRQVELKIKADYKNESSTSLKLKAPEVATLPADNYRFVRSSENLLSVNAGFNPPAGARLFSLYKLYRIYRI